MSARRALVASLFSTAIGVGAFISTAVPADAARLTTPPSAPRIEYADDYDYSTMSAPEEDSLYFDCRVHGNAICGPGALVPIEIAPGVVLLVPTEYAPAR